MDIGSRKKTDFNSSVRAPTNATMSSYQQINTNFRGSNIFSPNVENRTKTIDKEASVIFNDISIHDEKNEKNERNEKSPYKVKM